MKNNNSVSADLCTVSHIRKPSKHIIRSVNRIRADIKVMSTQKDNFLWTYTLYIMIQNEFFLSVIYTYIK